MRYAEKIKLILPEAMDLGKFLEIIDRALESSNESWHLNGVGPIKIKDLKLETVPVGDETIILFGEKLRNFDERKKI